MKSFRHSLCSPVDAIFDAAELLFEAANLHRAGDFSGMELRIREANCDTVRAYTENAWGKGSAARYDFQVIADAPAHFAITDRPHPRVPTAATRSAVIARDGHHCRFCGIPVINPAIRHKLAAQFPEAVPWGRVNSSQHAAFQCMWMQFDHILPNSRGGESSFDNIVIACAACNFGRMESTLEEANLHNPLLHDPPRMWKLHDEWTGLEYFRTL
jgi:5-methylcytosine-specific restriction endonuclease McrA